MENEPSTRKSEKQFVWFNLTGLEVKAKEYLLGIHSAKRRVNAPAVSVSQSHSQEYLKKSSKDHKPFQYPFKN